MPLQSTRTLIGVALLLACVCGSLLVAQKSGTQTALHTPKTRAAKDQAALGQPRTARPSTDAVHRGADLSWVDPRAGRGLVPESPVQVTPPETPPSKAKPLAGDPSGVFSAADFAPVPAAVTVPEAVSHAVQPVSHGTERAIDAASFAALEPADPPAAENSWPAEHRESESAGRGDASVTVLDGWVSEPQALPSNVVQAGGVPEFELGADNQQTVTSVILVGFVDAVGESVSTPNTTPDAVPGDAPPRISRAPQGCYRIRFLAAPDAPRQRLQQTFRFASPPVER